MLWTGSFDLLTECGAIVVVAAVVTNRNSECRPVEHMRKENMAPFISFQFPVRVQLQRYWDWSCLEPFYSNPISCPLQIHARHCWLVPFDWIDERAHRPDGFYYY